MSRDVLTLIEGTPQLPARVQNNPLQVLDPERLLDTARFEQMARGRRDYLPHVPTA
jgi:hypothetical protein